MYIYLPLGQGLRAALAGCGLGRKRRMRRASGFLLLKRRQAPLGPSSLALADLRNQAVKHGVLAHLNAPGQLNIP